MNNIMISQGMYLQDKTTGENFRIIHVTENQSVVINLDQSNRLDLRAFDNQVIRKNASNNIWEITKDDNPTVIVDENMLSDNKKLTYQRKKTIIEIINDTYAPSYLGLLGKQHKKIIEQIIKTTGIRRANLWRLIIRYLQSGCKESSLLRQYVTPVAKDTTTSAKRGRTSEIPGRNGKILTDDDRANMEKYTKKYLANRLITQLQCYDDMVIDCYTMSKFDGNTLQYIEFPADQRPSFRQFCYYIRQHTGKEERNSAKFGKRNYRNKKRVLKGTAMAGVFGPCDIVEMDACELDIAVVSATDRKKTVGSPVVYFMVDVYSRLIIAASISFDNNSVIALTNCLASLIEDKQKILQEMELSVVPTRSSLSLADVMPSHIKPRTVRLDHGSDFISKEKQRIAQELNIEIQYVPPGTGSLKGIVERRFRAFQSHFTELTAHAGTKDYSEGASKHNTEAKLTINDVKKLMYSFILSYNSTQHEGYDLTPDMVANKVGRIPAEIWRYGVEHISNPPYITNDTQFLYSLMTPAKARITRAGIVYKKLRYIPQYSDIATYDDIVAAKYGSKPMEIRIDLRNVGSIYYIDRLGHLQSANLVDDADHRILAQMSWPALEAHRKEERKLLAEKDVETSATRRTHRRISRDVVDDAKATSGKGKADSKDMRTTRAKERARVSQELAFDTRFGLTEEISVKPLPETKPTIEENNTENNIPEFNTAAEKEDFLLNLAIEMQEDDEDNQ